jgi:hypothetical protein
MSKTFSRGLEGKSKDLKVIRKRNIAAIIYLSQRTMNNLRYFNKPGFSKYSKQ